MALEAAAGMIFTLAMPTRWTRQAAIWRCARNEAGEGAFEELAALLEIGVRALHLCVQGYGTLTPRPEAGAGGHRFWRRCCTR